MAPPRRAIVRRRRRDAEEATEDERGDSQSEASFLSDEDADADASDLSESESVATRNGAPQPPNGQPAAPPAAASAAPMTDTEAMMNGLKISHDQQAVDFDTLSAEPVAPDAPAQHAPDAAQPAPAKQESLAERRRREHEEYKKKRDEDPAFIPNRGAFFMHDHRSHGAGSNGFKPIMAREEAATSAPWTHDLHETLEGPAQHRPSNPPANFSSNHPANDSQLSKPPIPNAKTPPVKSFSSTKLVGNARVRLYIPGMEAPIHFAGVPIKEYTKLPNHPGAVVPMYMPNPQQGAYAVPAVGSSMPAPNAPVTTAQGQMVAHEQNGMVYYFDPSQIYAPVEGYPPASYTVPGMGGMMTPSPDGYYYPQMPQGGMVYYPTQ
ncbi:hypothetical protein UCRNP2_1773 [Neofusicoccum parvum UCRNP2]|uniref:Btz domain-containing protein n=1 Tax=Botryosphaeria parva (strain UCR-NP2) TaxID=1287680 RepID=R1EV30_BOTPV|nr:hypothetical protein UCRNP2_1773 [Neofusicoccum parvum UCRNP2]